MANTQSFNTQPDEAVARIRLTLDLSPRLNSVLERIAQTKGVSKADVLRTAVEFLERANTAIDDGMLVGAWKDEKNGNRKEREFLGL